MCSTSSPRSSGRSRDAEVGLQVRRARSPTRSRAASAGQLGRVEHLQARVLVEQRLELGQLVVGLGAHHRRHEVVDDRRVRAALGLHALAGVVDDERVDERQRRRAPRRARTRRDSASILPGSHSSVPCLPRWTIASAPQSRVEPAVAGEVVVRGRRARGRGRCRPGPRRSRAAAGSRRARRRARARRSRSPRRRRSGRPAAGPSCSSIALAQLRRAASRTSRR